MSNRTAAPASFLCQRCGDDRPGCDYRIVLFGNPGTFDQAAKNTLLLSVCADCLAVMLEAIASCLVEAEAAAEERIQ